MALWQIILLIVFACVVFLPRRYDPIVQFKERRIRRIKDRKGGPDVIVEEVIVEDVRTD